MGPNQQKVYSEISALRELVVSSQSRQQTSFSVQDGRDGITIWLTGFPTKRGGSQIRIRIDGRKATLDDALAVAWVYDKLLGWSR